MLTTATSMATDCLAFIPQSFQFSLPHLSLNKIHAITILNPDLDILSGHLPGFPQV